MVVKSEIKRQKGLCAARRGSFAETGGCEEQANVGGLLATWGQGDIQEPGLLHGTMSQSMVGNL